MGTELEKSLAALDSLFAKHMKNPSKLERSKQMVAGEKQQPQLLLPVVKE